MKKFNFRLNGYLRIKEFEEKNAWNEVLKQEARIQNLKNKIDNLNMTILQSRERMNQVGREQGTDAAHLQMVEESITGMKAHIETLAQEHARESKTLEKLVLKHREIKKESKIITNFKERKKSDYDKERDKQIEKQSADFATQSFLRKVK